MKGRKDDFTKPPLDLIPYEFLEGLSLVLAFGATKYERYNWAKGMDWSRLIAASMRHIGQFESGQDRDSETGSSHLLHAACCIMFLYYFQHHKLGNDNRFKRP